MAEKKSAVTPERFASGFTFKDYVAQVTVNKDRFEEFYKTARLSPGDADFFRKAAQPPYGLGKVLVICEDWCPDAFRGVPAMARIAEAAGAELRIFPRDKNLDIMNEFLNQGEFQSIPTCVFYTKDLGYIAHWIERPAQANEERTMIETEVKKNMREATEQEIRKMVSARTQPLYPSWQQAEVQEVRKLLSQKLGMQ